jgi:hypothetical protein
MLSFARGISDAAHADFLPEFFCTGRFARADKIEFVRADGQVQFTATLIKGRRMIR